MKGQSDIEKALGARLRFIKLMRNGKWISTEITVLFNCGLIAMGDEGEIKASRGIVSELRDTYETWVGDQANEMMYMLRNGWMMMSVDEVYPDLIRPDQPNEV